MKNIVAFFTVLFVAINSWIFAADSITNPTIIIATDPTNPPMQMLDNNSQIVGFDIDVMNAAARAGGFKVKFINVAWDAIFQGLSTDMYDAIMSSVTITSERLQNMDFTVPYLRVPQVLLVRSNAEKISTFMDLSKKVVGVLSGSASEGELNKVTKKYGITSKTYGDLTRIFADLVESKVDAFFCDDYYAITAIRSQDPKYKNKMKIAGPALTQEKFGVAVKKGNNKILEILNTGLKKILASQEYTSLKNKWLK